jgi:hypothetical protein
VILNNLQMMGLTTTMMAKTAAAMVAEAAAEARAKTAAKTTAKAATSAGAKTATETTAKAEANT